jgi:serine/threonine protein kinase
MRVFIHRDGEPEKLVNINTAKKLGQGATAVVYRVNHAGQVWAAKIYHDQHQINLEKVKAMIEKTPTNAVVSDDNGNFFPQLAWPTALLKDDAGKVVGYLMPLVDTTESFTLDHYYDQILFKKLNSPDEQALSYKLEIARNLCALVAEMHLQGHYLIDCKPQNIRVFKKNHRICLIDCDGFSINGGVRTYPAELLSPDYIAPEVYRNNTKPSKLGSEQDRYAVAVILFQLFNRGTHPFQGVNQNANITASTNDERAGQGLYPYGLTPDQRVKPRPQSTIQFWDFATRTLFDFAFTGKPENRPSAAVWATHLETLLNKKSLQRCTKFPNSVDHIRLRDMPCPACYLSSIESFKPTPSASKNNKKTPSSSSTGFSVKYPKIPPPPKDNTALVLGAVGAAFFVFFLFSLINDGGRSKSIPQAPSSVEITPPNINPDEIPREISRLFGKFKVSCDHADPNFIRISYNSYSKTHYIFIYGDLFEAKTVRVDNVGVVDYIATHNGGTYEISVLYTEYGSQNGSIKIMRLVRTSPQPQDPIILNGKNLEYMTDVAMLRWCEALP